MPIRGTESGGGERAALELLYSSVRDMTSSLAEHELLGRLLERTLCHLQAEAGSLVLLDPEGRLRLVLSCGLPPDALLETRTNPREGVSGFVMAADRAFRTTEVECDDRFTLQGHERFFSNALAAAPVRIRGETRGVLCVCNREEPFGEHELALLEAIAGHAALALHNVDRYDEMLDRAERDVLTGVRNPAAFTSILKAEIARARRHERSLAVVLLDVDGFKAINERLGRLGGDALLRDLAQEIASSCRSHDTVARFEGDRFVVLLPEGRLEGACAFAEKIRRHVELNFPTGQGPDASEVTLSAGVVEFAQHGDDALALLAAGETALARAKQAGRNRVETP